MGNMDGWARPNVAVQPGSEQEHGCRCSVEYCRRLMGGGGHIMGAPTNWKDGLWGRWAKLPRVLEWQGQMGRSKCGVIWLEMGVGTCAQGKHCWGERERGGGAPMSGPDAQKKGRV